jgi:hypothetical protein
MLNLRDLQSRFFYSIARPICSADEEWQGFDPQLLQVIQQQGKLGAEARLDIYAQMYCARLLEVLVEDFPRVAAILGEDRFHELGRAYVRQSPSTHPSLRNLGAHFVEFVNSHPVTTSLPFLADLARLEWARLAVFDAPNAEPLQLENLQTIPVDAWPTIRFQLIPALQTLTCAWPVQTIWKNEQFTQSDSVEPMTTVLRVWRHDFAVYQASMDAVEQAALAGIQAGEPFAAVCAAVEPFVNSPEEVPTLIGSLLLRWIEDGILMRSYEV